MSEIPPRTFPPPTPPPPAGGSYTPPPPPPAGGSPASSDRTLMLVLSYLGILALIPLLTKKNDPEVQWHAKNGLALTIAEVIIWVALEAILWVLPSGISCLVRVVTCLVPLGMIVLMIICIMKAVKGERLRLPVITDLAEKM
jgi:uncharacterized membrane protein